MPATPSAGSATPCSCRAPGENSARSAISDLTDAVRAGSDAPGLYTFWDYQAGAWQKNDGIRIDHLLLSPQAADRLIGAGIDKHVRGWEKPSDHVPVWVGSGRFSGCFELTNGSRIQRLKKLSSTLQGSL